MITENGTNLERDLAQEVRRRSLPISEIQTTVPEIPSEPAPSCSESGNVRRKPRRPATVPMKHAGNLRKPKVWRGDARGQATPQLNPESESLASLVRRRRTAWTADELAEVLSLSRKHIYKLAKKGRMPSLRIGGAIRFDPHATAAWLESKAIQ
jgi:excisionase family DNA binding protein